MPKKTTPKPPPPRGDRHAMTWASVPKKPTPASVPLSRRARRAALIARKAAYREALRDWALGVAIDNPDALRAIGLRVAHERPTDTRRDVGGMDHALEAMERAAGRELPTTGPFLQGIIDAYHRGLVMWHARTEKRGQANARSPLARLAYAENEGRMGRMRVAIHTAAPVMHRRLYLYMYALAEPLIAAAFTPPARRTTTDFFYVTTTDGWSGSGSAAARVRHPATVYWNGSRGKKAHIEVRCDPNVIPLWRAGLAGHYGPKTLIIGVERRDPKKCVVARQTGLYTYVITRRDTPTI